MNKMIEFIQNNIHLLKPEHLKTFAKKNNINYTEEEIQIIYQFILEHYQELLEGNIKCLEIVKQKINPTLYNQLLSIYYNYKKRI